VSDARTGLEAVTALVHAYAERLDAGDLDGVARLFDRAVWRSPEHPEGLRGAEAVRRVYDGVRLYDGSPRTKHVISNLVVEVDERRGRARSRCSFTVIHGVDARSTTPSHATRPDSRGTSRSGPPWSTWSVTSAATSGRRPPLGANRRSSVDGRLNFGRPAKQIGAPTWTA